MHEELRVNIAPETEEVWKQRDKNRVRKFGREHNIESKAKRKDRENISLQEEVEKQKNDIDKNITCMS